MLEHTIGTKVIFSAFIKPLMLLGIALGFYPAFDFIILQVDSFIFLSPWWKEFFSELKVVLGVGITFLIFIKLVKEAINLFKGKK